MVNKKAGIITFHSSRNYGAVLQTYALQTKMKEYCSDVEIIDYQNKKIEDSLKLWAQNGKSVKSFIKAMLGFVFRYKKKLAFNAFKKYLNLSSLSDEEIINNNEYEILITGSDQVWNTEITDDDMHYYLDFAKSNQFKMAYAASFGDKKKTLSQKEAELIKKFDKITLREDLMLKDISNLNSNTPEICCDPCLLLNAEEWKQIKSERAKKQPFVFLFMIKDSQQLREYAQKLAKEKNIKLISNKNDINFFFHCTPNDFLSWIYNAEYVVTNSFHGTVFSLQFHKQFVSQIYDDNGNEKRRISELLSGLGCAERAVSSENLNVDEALDWSEIDRKIDDMRNRSVDIIKKTLL